MSSPSVGVIGAGKWGKNVIRALAGLGELAAVADLNADNLRAVHASFPDTPITQSADEIIESAVDAIAVTTSANTHVELALRAIARGKDVFVEKPLALTEEGAIAVARAAEKRGCKVFVGHLLLYHQAIVTLQETIARGEIGDIVHVRLRRLSPGRIRTNENVWWSFAPHDVALMLSLLGEPESYSACEHARMQEGISDFVYADLQFDAGRTAHIEVSWLDPDKSSRIDVFGTRGVISVETARAVSTLAKRSFRADRPSEGVLPTSYGEPIVESFPGIDPLRDELQAFLRWVRGGPVPPTDVANGVRVVRALASIALQSAANAHNNRVAGGQRFNVGDGLRRPTHANHAPL